MSYEEFILSLKGNLNQYFTNEKESYKMDTVTSYGINDTNNDRISIWRGEERTGISVGLQSLYEQYMENGLDMNSVVRYVADVVRNSGVMDIKEAEGILSMVSDWNMVKNRVTCRLINKERNKDYLQDKPYTDYQDLAVMYKIILERNSEGVSAITITNKMLSAYGISKEQLHDTAIANMIQENRATLIPLWESLKLFFPEKEWSLYEDDMLDVESDSLLVVSNPEFVDGAAEIINPELQKRIAEKVGGDYFVLPSSVHEVIIVVKAFTDMDYMELQENVKMINKDNVLPEQWLSDHVYEYNAKMQTLTICGQEHIREQEHQEHQLSEAERDVLELALDYGLTDDLELERRQEIERENRQQERSIQHGKR